MAASTATKAAIKVLVTIMTQNCIRVVEHNFNILISNSINNISTSGCTYVQAAYQGQDMEQQSQMCQPNAVCSRSNREPVTA